MRALKDEELKKFKEARHGEELSKQEARCRYDRLNQPAEQKHMGGLPGLVEARIRQAIMEGQFDDLAGKGEPQDIESYGRAPEHLRMAYHFLSNANVLPEEVRLKKEIEAIRNKFAKASNEEERARLHAELAETSSRFHMAMEYNNRFKKSF